MTILRFVLLIAGIVSILFATGCGGGQTAPTPAEAVKKATSTYTPTPTDMPVPTNVPSQASGVSRLEWPSDVGTSHIGALGQELEGFPGGWIRPLPGNFVWGEIEPVKGRYLWEKTDRWVRKWQKERLATLVMIWPFVAWDQNICHAEEPAAVNPRKGMGDRLYGPCDSLAYASWLSAAVERYDGDGIDDMPGLEYPIRYWEVGNEPDMQGPNLTIFQGDPPAYLELLKLSYTTIKSADPTAVVLIAAPSQWPETIEYWRPIMEGGTGYFDVGNMHSLKGDDDFRASEYRDFLDEYGAGNKPFWITEAGVFVAGKALEQEELSKITIPNYASAFAQGAQRIFRLNRGHSSGQVLETYLLMARTIGDFVTATHVADNLVQFDMPDGSTVFAIWDGGTLPVEATGEVKAITYKGTESNLDASAVIAEVPTLVVIESGIGPLTTVRSITKFQGATQPAKQIPTETDITFCTVEGVPLKLDLHFPDHPDEPSPAVIFLHEGSWWGGDKQIVTRGPVLAELTSRGYLIAAVNYRLSPEFKFPAHIQDAKCAVRYLRANSERLGIDPTRIAAWGRSAGGHLAMLLGLADESAGWDQSGQHIDQSSSVQAVVDMYGPIIVMDGICSKPKVITEVFGTPECDPEVLVPADPLTHISSEDPPFLILHSDGDPIVPSSYSQTFYKHLTEAGVPATLVIVDHDKHHFNPEMMNPSYEEVAKIVADFLDEALR